MPHPRGTGLVALLLVALAACTTDGSAETPAPSSTPSAAAPSSAMSTPVELPRAQEQPTPEGGACYDLSYADALAPTSRQRSVPCERDHRSETFAVGRLDTVVDGHLLAVDAARVQEQPAAACERRLADHLGGTEEDRRLSMLRTVWFTPTVAQSDRGAEWWRCDVIAVAADEELAALDTGTQGVLDQDEGAARYGMCGTAAPDAEAFERVICSRQHSWRAVSVVDLGGGDYPGRATARERGQVPCEDAGRELADDPLDYAWGYEWPTPEQWAGGQTYGRCWAPD